MNTDIFSLFFFFKMNLQNRHGMREIKIKVYKTNHLKDVAKYHQK